MKRFSVISAALFSAFLIINPLLLANLAFGVTPTVTTLPASEITSTHVYLRASINPGGRITSARIFLTFLHQSFSDRGARY